MNLHKVLNVKTMAIEEVDLDDYNKPFDINGVAFRGHKRIGDVGLFIATSGLTTVSYLGTLSELSEFRERMQDFRVLYNTLKSIDGIEETCFKGEPKYGPDNGNISSKLYPNRY